MGVEQNATCHLLIVVNIRKSVILHADVMQIIVAIPCQIIVADIDRNQNVIIKYLHVIIKILSM